MSEYLKDLQQKLGYATGSGQILGINPMEKETIELLKEQDFDFSIYLQPPTPVEEEEEEE